MSQGRVLVVDDEEQFRSSLARSLRVQDYEVQESATGEAAVTDRRSFSPDIVLLDLMLPDKDGLIVCREMRRETNVPIIVLTVLGDERSKVLALDEGADDYMTKPFGSQELMARMRAALRRAGPPADADTLVIGPLRIDQTAELVYLNDVELRLTPLELSLLRYFVANMGRVVRHQTILTEVWGREYAGDTQILRTFVKQLRSKLGDDQANPRFIRTELGIGYRFMAPQ
jgi:two-component system KDP operon response regulator KdpE